MKMYRVTSKHELGRRRPHGWRRELNARRKRERQHRKRVRRQLAGRKHVR
jgi:hypothetical protein